MAHYEIEVKSLLGDKEQADKLRKEMCERDPSCACTSTNKQLNHYFKDGNIEKLFEQTKHLFDAEAVKKFEKIAEKGTDFSVRSRQKDDEVLLVVKASMDEGNAINSVSRMEFEENVDVSLDELDALIQQAGYTYDSKWSREREEYIYKGVNVTIDRNAGYGYLTEFEKVTEDESDIAEIRKEIADLMNELSVEELPHDRHDRMYAHYRKNWPEYYGTDKIFNIE